VKKAMKTYLSTVRTPSYSLVHDAARPFAVVEVSKETGLPTHVLSRHETSRGAAIACGKAIKRSEG
jgi:hypothetical protein